MHNSDGMLSATDSPGFNASIIYPNPLTDWLYMDLPDMITDIRITDIYGKIHYTSPYFGPSKINTQTFSQGVYFVQGLYKHSLLLVQKIIKL